jgi:hypothetical protein
MNTTTSRERATHPANTLVLAPPQHIRCRQNLAWQNWGETARCQPAFSFYPQRVDDLMPVVHFAHNRRLPVAQVMENLKDMVLAHDNLDLFWWPFCDEFWVKSWHPVEAAITAKPRQSLRDTVGAAITSRFYKGSLELMKAFPKLIPTICPITFNATPSVSDDIVDVVKAIHYRRAIKVTKMGCIEVAPGIIEHIKSSYGENIHRFNQIEERLQVDPAHTFVNDALQEVFLT